jgi:hypothetical protein
MENNAYIGELIGGVVYLIVGVRLLWLGQRSGETPERLLAASVLSMAVAACFYVLPSFPAFEAHWDALSFAGRVAIIGNSVFFALFTRRVFRPDARWGAWLVWVIAISLVTGVGGSAMVGDWEGYSIHSGWFQIEWVGYTLPYAWAGAEAFAQFLQARRRVRLGLCDRLVCNRYLLWSLFALFQVGLCLVVLPQYAEYQATNQFTATWDAIYGAIEVASLVMIWLVFFPPAFYRRWINRAAPTIKAVES